MVFSKSKILNANAAKGANDAKKITRSGSRFFALFAQFALKLCHKNRNESTYFEKALNRDAIYASQFNCAFVLLEGFVFFLDEDVFI